MAETVKDGDKHLPMTGGTRRKDDEIKEAKERVRKGERDAKLVQALKWSRHWGG
jgi:hypothetical protein